MNKFCYMIILVLMGVLNLTAQPDFSSLLEINGIRCYRDINTPDIAYYAPGKLRIATNRDDKPDFNFIQTRYTGSYLYADQGSHRFHSILRFRVVMERTDPELLASVRSELFPGNRHGELRPIAISDIETLMVFAVPETENNQADTYYFSNGSIISEGEEGQPKKGSFWREREYSLRLDPTSSNVFWNNFSQNYLAMIFAYAFYSKGVVSGESDFPSSDIGLPDDLASKISEINSNKPADRFLVFSDAFSIDVDLNKWPGLLKKLDINEEIPPGYPALEIRCYDFNNEIRDDLYSKTIELKAKGIGRGDVITRVRFDWKNPDQTVFHVRFRYAVRIDAPLWYRIIEVPKNEPLHQTDWMLLDSWIGLIDVTSRETKTFRVETPDYEE
jgi:hypothetical protein